MSECRTKGCNSGTEVKNLKSDWIKKTFRPTQWMRKRKSTVYDWSHYKKSIQGFYTQVVAEKNDWFFAP